jgi:Cu2+-containing amine oxidase
LIVVEEIVRKDPKVIEQCGILGIPPEDMHKVYCDPWTIGMLVSCCKAKAILISSKATMNATQMAPDFNKP